MTEQQTKDLLQSFCATDDIRPKLAAPFTSHGKVCASDTRNAIIIDSELVPWASEYAQREEFGKVLLDIAHNYNWRITLADVNDAVSKIPLADEEIDNRETCPECDGYGEVEWSYEDKDLHTHHEYHECPVCDGSGYIGRIVKSGKQILDDRYPIAIGLFVVASETLLLIKRTMEAVGVTEATIKAMYCNSPCKIQMTDGIYMVFMPWVNLEGDPIPLTYTPQ